MPSTPASERDERLSAYLDGALVPPQRTQLEAEAERDVEVRVALEGMRAVRASLGSLGFEHAPRSFALQPGTVRPSPALPRIELFARVGAVAAALVLTVVSVLPTTTFVSTLASKPQADSALSGAQSTGAPRDAATAVADTRKQAEQSSGARAAAPATGANESAPAIAPAAAPAGAPAAAPQAPPARPSSGAPSGGAAAPSPETPSKAAIREPTASATPLPPLPLQRLDQGPVWLSVQIVLAVAASTLTLLAAALWLRRRGSL
ncbi:MAG: hypothetical protein U0360_10340 [Dehalococcoidia bacterium]